MRVNEMRVFVTGTGRCGSVCFARACSFMTNYTCGHETVSAELDYQDNHIEVSPHIRCVIPEIWAKYPESKWVHLRRRKEDCVPSLSAMGHGSVMECFRQLYYSALTEDSLEIASRFYDIENRSISMWISSLVPLEMRTVIRLHEAKQKWGMFWSWVGAEGDFDSSLRCWDTPVNTREERGEHESR